MGKKGVIKKPARKPTRVPCVPDWAVSHGITAAQWEQADRNQRERWRCSFLYVYGSEGSGGEEGPRPEHGPDFREYSICDLDLSVAREAVVLHRWEDGHCLEKLMGRD